ncbi:hypothetical protein [Umezawaea sp. Da 62-37]|uniref:hypothetical protein n=1 Tax=Umezawaea sp. Da 62-37 TaxID=3075927 RepID=UPI0028F735D4|nr:hypothetical protein [Umezawaea sp. Da 62-37]WNV82914.1 hypothetical protein RM788_32575 [Umezawaea sp. Da 62-37]
MFSDDDDFVSDDEAPVDLERAKELVLARRDSLIAGTTASQTDAKPDPARYRRDHSRLGTILQRTGIREPFPWPRIAEALAAAKTEHYGPGAHRKRTVFFKSRAQEVLDLLDTRIADRDSGDITSAIGEVRETADLALLDTSSLRRELGRAEAALPVDASTAISKAKTLMEVVAKRVIIENGAEIESSEPSPR